MRIESRPADRGSSAQEQRHGGEREPRHQQPGGRSPVSTREPVPSIVECRGEVLHPLKARVRVRVEGLLDRGGDRLRDFRTAPVQWLRRSLKPARERGPDRRAVQRRHSREHLVEDAPQAEDVAPAVHQVVPARLFGAHVLRRSHDHSDVGEPTVLARLPVHSERHAEVGEQRVPVLEQDVLRLDVAVHHAARVGEGERVRHLAGDTQRLLDRQPTDAGHPLAERLALDEWHDVVGHAVGDSGVVHRKDAGMLERSGEAYLAQEAILAELRTGAGPEDLDGDRTSMAAIHRAIDDGHGAFPRLVTELEPAFGELLAENQARARHTRDQAAFSVPRTCAWKALGVRP